MSQKVKLTLLIAIFFTWLGGQPLRLNTFLWQAVYNDDVQATQDALNQGADVNAQDASLNTPLIYAVFRENLPLVELLVTRGAKQSLKNETGKTALMIAAHKNNKDLVEYLLKTGGKGKKNIMDRKHRTALAFATDPKIRDILALSPEGRPQGELIKNAQAGNLRGVLEALNSGAKINETTNDSTALIEAIKGMANALDKWGLPVEQKEAIKKQYLDVINLLLERKAKTNIADAAGNTPLLFAVQYLPEVVEFLIEAPYPADPNRANKSGMTPLSIAIAGDGNIEVVKKLLAYGADKNKADGGGNTPLILAVGQGHQDIADLLLKRGVPVNVRNKEGLTPLIIATMLRSTKMVEKLLSYGANPNVYNEKGETPLGKAVSRNLINMVKALIKAGAIIPSGLQDNSLIKQAQDEIRQEAAESGEPPKKKVRLSDS